MDLATTREGAVRAAAQAFIDHGGPKQRTDPKIPTTLLGHALNKGATHEDVKAEMGRLRKAANQ